ncbi:serine hydrolase domain-containing protein [Paenibacillus soyae]|uniref:Beta-lactamase family protein n=1 Tax=Paenibacillus soyae TaxID=2969249 RepID=A0A9X2MTM4_9BACL|nr:serine hydrolase [Paenibacillus soyae]MCR2805546.1 beta-lactamase family protein [Paenibacillus soyae]
MKQLKEHSIEEAARERRIKSYVVYRDGRLLEEWHESGRDAIGPLYSCTKSVLSTLIGIALHRGEIESLRQPISVYLGDVEIGDENGHPITIEHLLTMTPGFDWPDFDKPYKTFRASQDPVAFTLARPVIHTPGHAFTYNSGGSHLLSAILTKATGQSALQYAERTLFGPLGFRAAKWTERGGISEGGTGLSLYGHDLAKIGLLYLRRGRWDDRQLLPGQWVEEAASMRHRALLHYEPPIYGGYGYHWWVSPQEHNGCADCYFAFGHGGQYLMNIPSLDLTVVVRKKITKRNEAIHARSFIFEHLVPLVSR